ncbi:hypothetical protein [Sphingomonas oryzagri]
MAGAALLVSLGFLLLGLTPMAVPGIRAAMTDFSIDYSFWLDCVAILLAGWLFVLARQQPASERDHSQ